MNVYKLKREVSKTAPYFFSRGAMKFFGDTMSNFGVKSGIAMDAEEEIPVWILYRKRSENKYLLDKEYYFRKDNFKML